MLAPLRTALSTRLGEAAALIRYGGSTDPDNARTIVDSPDVEGVLIGGASLLAAGFNDIVDVTRLRMPS